MALQFSFQIIILMIWPTHLLASAARFPIMAQPGCNSSCGEIEIPYPFGIGHPKCYADNSFEIECKNSNQGPKPYLKRVNLEVRSINISGTVLIMNPVLRLHCQSSDAQQFIDLRGSPFVYSHTFNNFVAVGCNKIAFLLSNDTQASVCASICPTRKKKVNVNYGMEGGCHGVYCCQNTLPAYLSEYNATVEDINGSENDDQCSYALIVKRGCINLYGNHVSVYDLGINKSSPLEEMNVVPAVLEWKILNKTIRNPNARCQSTSITDSGNTGRSCNCNKGFQGNPYIAGGCIAITESPLGIDPEKKMAIGPIAIVLSSVVSIILLLGLWRLYKILRKTRIKKRREKFFRQNGGLLLQQKLSSGEVSVDKVKHFSLKDLAKATDHFNKNRVLGKGGQGTVYKGMLVDGNIVAVKKFKVQGLVEEFINEFVILSQINHRNVVKLLGCCLETKIPLLVYEFIPNGTLFEYLHEQNEELPMTWDMRLRIATEVAEALFYLHSAASQPIYHRDIKSTNILLDGKYRAKVGDFGASRMISIEATHLTTIVQGTFGYLDPEYFHTSQFTEKSDVYSFGVVLVELLTGQMPISSGRTEEAKSLASYFVISMDENRLFDIVDERVSKEAETAHIIVVANLAKRCLNLNGRKRPTMKEVTMELEGIRRLERKSNAQKNHEEVEIVGIEDYQLWAACSTSNTGSTLNSGTFSPEMIPTFK